MMGGWPDVIPAGTYQGDWIEQRFKYFDFFNIEIVTEEADYAAAATQRQLLALRAELVGLTNDDGSSYIVQPAPAFWLEEFTNWVGAAEADGRDQRLDAEGLIPTASFYEYYYQVSPQLTLSSG